MCMLIFDNFCQSIPFLKHEQNLMNKCLQNGVKLNIANLKWKNYFSVSTHTRLSFFFQQSVSDDSQTTDVLPLLLDASVACLIFEAPVLHAGGDNA